MRRSAMSEPLFRNLLIGTIVLLGLAVAAAFVYPEPMTMDQAKAWAATASADDVARKLVALETILQAQPVVVQQPQLYVLDGRDLVVSGGMTTLEVPFPGKDGPLKLHYTIMPADRRIPGFAPPDHAGEVLLWEILAAAAAVGGLLLGHALAK
jgi:hypothetical protein